MESGEDIAKVIEHARLIATAAHYGQCRRDGATPYITHPEAVAAAVEDRLKPIAWLHDVVEDTWITIGCLEGSPIPSYVVDAVEYLTKRHREPYINYITRLCQAGGTDAITVKLSDMRHNLSCQPSQNSIEKAKWAIPMLESALK